MSDAPILDPMTIVDDYAGADDFVKKHTPFIDVTDMGDKKLITLTVGKDVPHPNLPDHYIAWVLLRANGNPIARFDFTPVAVDPKVSVVIAVDAGTEITAIGYCNLHGLFLHSVMV
jgi:superoxide reductase